MANKFLHSIPVKVCLVILLVETVLLTVMGSYYVNRFCREIDRNHREKMLLPATLMSDRALNFDTVTDYQDLGKVVNEQVTNAFISKLDGTVFYSRTPQAAGTPYQALLDPEEVGRLTEQEKKGQLIKFTGSDGKKYISSFAPLSYDGKTIGHLYIKINADHIAATKKNIILLFVIGSLLTIALTTLIEALFIRQLLSPRIKDICTVLNRVANGDLTARVSSITRRDEIDDIGSRLNNMITTVEQATSNLQQLNQSGELFATVENRQDIYAIICRAVSKQLDLIPEASCPANKGRTGLQSPCPCLKDVTEADLSRLNNGEILIITHETTGQPEAGRKNRARLFLPLQEDERKGHDLLCFSVQEDRINLTAIEQRYLYTLQSMAANALGRLTLRTTSEEAANKYQELFNSALEGIFNCSLEGRLTVANPSLAEMTGYDSVDHMLAAFNQQGASLFRDAEEERRIRECIDAREEIRDEDVRLRRRDGSLFWAAITARARRNAAGEMVAVEGAVVNIEERKFREKTEREQEASLAADKAKSEMLTTLKNNNQQLEQTLAELHKTQNSLMRSERMAAIGMTASGVAHDLNNILSGVINYPELILSKLPADSELRKPLKAIHASGLRAAAVVDDLLTLTRGTAINKRPADLNRLINDYLTSTECKTLTEHHPDIRIRTTLTAPLPPILCAPVYIHKIIMNLVTNSIEAMGKQGELQIVTKLAATPDDDSIILQIIDNGPGIADTDLDHIFEPFYSKKVMGLSGTGLGMTIVQNAVMEHNGSITVASSSKGTTVTIALPVDHSRDTPSQHETEEKARMVGSGTVLVVDDEAIQRNIAESILQDAGYTVSLVSSGEEAVAFLREQEVDLILLDMLMPPGINGRQTYESISEIRPGQKALIVSGFSEDNEVKKAIKAGCLGFLSKPYSLEQLVTAVQNGMGR